MIGMTFIKFKLGLSNFLSVKMQTHLQKFGSSSSPLKLDFPKYHCDFLSIKYWQTT